MIAKFERENMRRFFFVTSGILFTLVVIRVVLSFVLGPQLHDAQNVDFTATILSQPQIQNNLTSFSVNYSNVWGSQLIRIVTPRPEFSYGQDVHIVGNVKEKVLEGGQIVYSIYFPTLEAKGNTFVLPLNISSWIAQRIQHIYARSMSKDEASLLLGIVLGVKGNFSDSLLTAFKTTGVMHVIAASGMNVTLVAGFLVSILGRYFKRQYVSLVTIVALVVYCILAGLQPSIVRATIMGSLGLVAQLYGRQYSGAYGLFLAASALLLIHPNLIQDVGFQLSFTSSLGILMLHPHVSKIPFLGEDISTTISSQIATLPILLITFGQYGMLSILVNALVLWTVAPLMILGAIAAIIGLIILPIGSVIALFSLPFLWYFERVVLFFGNIPATFSVGQLPMVWVVGYYVIIVSVVWIIQQKINEKVLTNS